MAEEISVAGGRCISQITDHDCIFGSPERQRPEPVVGAAFHRSPTTDHDSFNGQYAQNGPVPPGVFLPSMATYTVRLKKNGRPQSKYNVGRPL